MTPSLPRPRAGRLAAPVAATLLVALGPGIAPTSAQALAPADGADAAPAVTAAPEDSDPLNLLARAGTGDSAQSGDGTGSAGLLDQAAAADGQDVPTGGDPVTMIVQLEPGHVGIPWYRTLLGVSDRARHEAVQDRIEDLVEELSSSGTSGQDDAVIVVADYTHVLDGFAVTVPADAVEGIQKVEGVQAAFVENVQDVPTPADPGDAPEFINASSLAMTGADRLTQTGDGQVIAVIDSGLDITHEAFSGDLDDDRVDLTRSEAESLAAQLPGGKTGTYVSEKIPFAWDYADGDDDVIPSQTDGMEHGTHVSGIVAANAGQIRGTAPDAQLMMLKVARDVDGAIPDSVLLAALDDAAVLRPDVINMSLGVDAGLPDPAGTVFSEVYDTIGDLGITLNVAAGNAYSSALQNASGASLPYASDPDSSTVAEPSTYDQALSVASVDNAGPQPYVTAADGRRIAYLQAQGSTGQDVAQFSALPDGDYPYVEGGTASAADIEALSAAHADGLDGMFVLVDRGGTDASGEPMTFEAKVAALAPLSPAAIILVDNIAGETLPTPGIETAAVPTIMISQEDGQALRQADATTLTVVQGQTAVLTTDYAMSSFSSWGVGADLTLKPEISAPGGRIQSALPDGAYGELSGTSMATPQMAGLSADVRERIEEDPAFEGLSDGERADLVTQLLMGTAQPLVDPAAGSPSSGDEDGASGSASVSYYSPRKQGAGIADAVAATSALVYPTVDGAKTASRPKADLGDGTSGWSFTITLHNADDSDHGFSLESAALSEQIADGLFQERSDNWTGHGIDVSYTGDVRTADGATTVTVPARSTAQVTVDVRIGSAFADFAARRAPNGTFVDGFTFLRAAEDSGVDLSVPFLGFYGDWNKAPVFDATAWEGTAHLYPTALASSSTGLPLGLNPLDELVSQGVYRMEDIDPERFVVSAAGYSSAPSSMQPVTGTLRTAEHLDYVYANAQGETVRSHSFDNAHKSLYNAVLGSVDYVEASLGNPVFDGLDDSGTRLPEGRYTLTETATLAGDGAAQQSQSFAFDYDLTGPRISDLATQDVDGVPTVTFTVRDNTWLSAIDFHDPSTGGWFHRELAGDPDSVDPDGQKVYHFSVPVQTIENAWTSAGLTDPMPAAVPLYAWDYGLNPSERSQAVITPVAMTGVSVAPAELALAPGQQGALAASIEPEDATSPDLVWTSDDDSVATVVGDGFRGATLTGVSEGQAHIAVASAEDPTVQATATVTVAAVAEDVGILLSRSEITLEPGGRGAVDALLAPALDQSGATVTWTSSDTSLVGVEPSEDTRSATLTSQGATGDALVTSRVEGADGTAHEAQLIVHVRPADYGDFVIDADGVLQYYRGSSRHVEIPGNVTAVAEEAFAGATMESVRVPAGVTSIGDRAFASAPNLRRITFEDTSERPSMLRSLGSDLIDNTLSMDEVLLPRGVTTIGARALANSTLKRASIPDGVTELPDGLFAGDAQLSDVAISDSVTVIGDGVFSADGSLATLTLRTGADDGETAGAGAESGVSGTRTGLPRALAVIGNSAFAGTAIPAFDLPEGVTSIGDDAFALTPAAEITLNDGLRRIGARAFQGTPIVTLSVPDSVTDVGDAAFGSLPRLTALRLGSNIGQGQLIGAFTGTPSLREITLDPSASNYTLSGGVLYDKALTLLVAYPAALPAGEDGFVVPEGVTEVADKAFQEVPLSRVAFPRSLRTIGVRAFTDSGLTEVALPEGFETIGATAFQGIGSLTRVDLGGTTVVGSNAFDSDTSLSEVDMRPDLQRLTAIGEGAFGSVPLARVNLPDSVVSIGSLAFANNGALEEVHIGAGVTSMDMGIFTGSNGLSTLTVSEGNPVYSAEENVLYAQQEDGLHLVLSLPTNAFAEYSVKPGTVQVDAQAFRNNTALTRVALPEGLRVLGPGAFNGDSALSEVEFPDSLQVVDGFYMTGLTEVNLGTQIQEVKENAFMGRMPERIVVRGGVDGRFSASMDFENTVQRSAYFGEGMTSVDYGYGVVPRLLVLPSTLASLSLSTYESGGDGARVLVAGGSDGPAWQVASDAMSAAGMDPGTQLEEYAPLDVTVSADPGTVAPGAQVPATAEVTGGVDEGRQVRFLQIGADGSQSVLQDWADATEVGDGGVGASFMWTVPEDGSTLRAEVRDATLLTDTADLGFASAPVLTSDLGGVHLRILEGDPGPELGVTVQPPADGAEISYQWYEGDAALEGATAATYVPEGLAVGDHTFHVVVRATLNGLSTVTVSQDATVTVLRRAQAPMLTANLPAQVTLRQGEEPDPLAVAAVSPDGGTLTYQWSRDGVALGGAEGPTLVPDTSEAGTHRYRVVVTNTVGDSQASVSSAVATVTVEADASGDGGQPGDGPQSGGGGGQAAPGDPGQADGAVPAASGPETGSGGLASSGASGLAAVAVGTLLLAAAGAGALALRRRGGRDGS
ncbi:MAG: leucine-rich repeat protein [Actinomyces sp.]|nr:leucine-rich repeat protein [Actinomyces sp.]MCI1661469.1 leucine-rich repeat protein [Actinomyces sp.]MCI1690866.1 leucine-rich repeat protein [Actinomyces sp.]